MDRDEYAAKQAAMTANWYEGVKRREGDVEAYIAKRQLAYLDRWGEAGRFIKKGSRVLDIGGGNIYIGLIEYFKAKELDYFYRDVDVGAVEASRNLAETRGFKPANFEWGFNDELNFDNAFFDCVFSSHCIEHSVNVSTTLCEIHRVLKPGGFALIAVPFGWELNPEHPYFFGPAEWVSLIEDHGFDIHVAQVGKEYPENGYDFFIAARKIERMAGPSSFDAMEFRKEHYKYIPFDDPSISYGLGKILTRTGDAVHMKGSNWAVEILPEVEFKSIAPIVANHGWSGNIEIRDEMGGASYHDLFSWFPYVKPQLHHLVKSGHSKLTIRPVGKNAASKSSEAVFYGYLIR